ncbi:aminotransferase class I/II-fold pyridoxal phosphate-dependent enzyme [Listeria booriae]|uniref:Aminotransferase class I/II-fold pyridoxal phosphate-dependent enzyme n=1 Tax=Listeria booriae TaxID=1552123 RepID=A0A841ZZD2_9LIST|nr:aminotransferase class I/II-fold pyridoxal phosphate-dependent enzyme [Listeria booriae]MBC1565610.1 aminotransferase class I/II-fold pyridoxal phosphate-dependent enzyme [Listeria booriae]
MEKILLSPPHMSGAEQSYIDKAFATNWIAPLGPNVNQFERDLAAYNSVEAVTATSTGTAAIHLALKLLHVQPGDTIFCSTFTFIASINPALYEKAVPVFIDAEKNTWGMSPKALQRALEDAAEKGQLPKAIIIVHIYGQSVKMDEIMALANQYNIPVIEDAAEALGSTYKGKKLGTFGEFGIYSFNGNKIITTSGGGALVSNKESAINHARFLSTQAKEQREYYHHVEVGYNYRLSNILAGIGIAQLQVLEERIAKKRAIFDHYEKGFRDISNITMMPELADTKSNRWLTTLLIQDADPIEIMKQLTNKGIEARLLWKPLHCQPIFKDNPFYEHQKGTKSVAEGLFAQGLCLPSGTQMTEEQQNYVITTMREILAK